MTRITVKSNNKGEPNNFILKMTHVDKQKQDIKTSPNNVILKMTHIDKKQQYIKTSPITSY